MGKQLTRFFCKLAVKIQIVRHFIGTLYLLDVILLH